MIFGPFERMVAARYLRSRRKEGFVSVIVGFSFLGIALGVATLIIVMAVMNGFREDMTSRILGVNGHIDVYSSQPISRFDDLDAEISKIPGVVRVTPMIEGQVMVSSDLYSSGALVRGVRGEDLAARPLIAERIERGSIDAFTQGQGILIGARMAERFGVNVGDEITLISPKGNVTAFGMVPRLRAFPIAGIFNVGISDIDSSIIFMPLEEAQVYFKYPETVSNIEIHLDDPNKARAVAVDIAVANPSLRVLSWEQTNPLFTALQVERNVMFIILTLIIIVAAFNIISGLIMLVKDKSRDIAILRTMGATGGTIMRIFLLTGTTVGTIGTVLGFVIGLVFCDNIESIRQFLQKIMGVDLFSPEIYYLTQIPAKIDWSETISIVLLSLALSFAATRYPSWRAARTDPVEALRDE